MKTDSITARFDLLAIRIWMASSALNDRGRQMTLKTHFALFGTRHFTPECLSDFWLLGWDHYGFGAVARGQKFGGKPDVGVKVKRYLSFRTEIHGQFYQY